MQKTKRDSRFETLRIVSMVLIILHHFACHGGYDLLSAPTMNQSVINTTIVGGKLGVNVFLLITGYFMIDKQFKFSRFIKLWLELLFYSIVIYVLFVLFGKKVAPIDRISAFFPIISKEYWFITYYIILYLLSPLINKLEKSLSKFQLMAVIIIIATYYVTLHLLNKEFLHYTGWFIVVYLISAYIKRYPNKLFNSFRCNFIAFIITFSMLIVFNTCFGINLYDLNSVVCLVCAIALFCTFKNIKPFYSKTINILSGTMLGVYLIHDNPLIRSVIWTKIFRCPELIANKYFVLFAIGVCALVFTICVVVDLIRQYAIVKPIYTLIGRMNKNKNGKLTS